MKDPIDIHVGQRMELRRKMLGVSMERLGEQVGIAYQQVSRYASGENRISAARLWRIANVLQCDVAFFFEGLTSDETVAFQDPMKSNEAMRLVRIWQRIDAQTRAALLRFIEHATAGRSVNA